VREHGGVPVVRVEAEVASGVTGRRPKLRRLLADPPMGTVVVTDRDRLARTNAELVEAALSAHGRRLVVLDDGEVADDLIGDMVEVLTSYCARLYGRWSAPNRALKAVGCTGREVGPVGAAAAAGGDGDGVGDRDLG
jgi:putative resolvase